MGLFKRAKKWVDAGQEFRQIENGVAGTAVITTAEQTGRSIGQHGDGDPVYKLGLRVSVPGRGTFDAEHIQWTPAGAPPEIGRVVSVTVNPDDSQDLIVDWRRPPNTATGSGATVAESLATGVSGRATINKISETGKVTEDNGDPILGFVLDVRVDGRDPYELKLFHRVPCEDRPQVTVGLDVPIKALPPDPNEIAIDWATAF